MQFKRALKIFSGLDQMNVASMVNIFFLLLIFFVFSLVLTMQSSIVVRLPKTLTSDSIREESLSIIITGENVMSLNGKVITMKELRRELQRRENKGHPVLIKADRHTSLGRIIDVWNLSRELGIKQVNMATTQEE